MTARDHRDARRRPTPKADAKADKAAAKSAAKLRNRRNSVTIAAGIKLLIFTIVSILVTGLLAAIMGNFGFGDSTEYKAVFSDRLDAREGRRRPGRRRQRRRGQEGRALQAQRWRW